MLLWAATWGGVLGLLWPGRGMLSQIALGAVLCLGQGPDEVLQTELPLPPASLKVSAGFDPLELVSVVSGAPPFRLVAGRLDTPAADNPLPELSAAVAGRAPGDLPLATLGPAQVREPARGFWARVLTQQAQARNLTLWGVLVAGMLVLAGAAWRLLRQLNAPG